MHRIKMAINLLWWDVLERLGRSTTKAQMRVVETTFKLNIDAEVMKAVSREATADE